LRVEVTDNEVANDFYAATKANYRSDSGFDLFMPAEVTIPARSMVMIDLGVRTQVLDPKNNTFGYYLYPRSSISKTPLRLANSVGIIDAGYRGTLKVAVDNISDVPYTVKRGERLFQVCLPNLMPFQVEYNLVDRYTERGEGGFGSTNSPKAS
jgi:dUTP pyrophosphatase